MFQRRCNLWFSCVKAWADAFRSSPDLTGVVSVYEDLRRKGLEFPMTELNGYTTGQPQQKVQAWMPHLLLANIRVLPVIFGHFSFGLFLCLCLPDYKQACANYSSFCDSVLKTTAHPTPDLWAKNGLRGNKCPHSLPGDGLPCLLKCCLTATFVPMVIINVQKNRYITQKKAELFYISFIYLFYFKKRMTHFYMVSSASLQSVQMVTMITIARW